LSGLLRNDTVIELHVQHSLPSEELYSSMSLMNEVVTHKSCDITWYWRCHHVL